MGPERPRNLSERDRTRIAKIVDKLATNKNMTYSMAVSAVLKGEGTFDKNDIDKAIKSLSAAVHQAQARDQKTTEQKAEQEQMEQDFRELPLEEFKAKWAPDLK